MDDEVDDRWLRELLERAGRPVPCGRCGVDHQAAELREVAVPYGVVDFDLDDSGPRFVLDQVLWLCPRCRPN